MNTVEIDSFAGAHEALGNPTLKQTLYDAGAVVMDKVLLTLHGDEHRARRILELKVFRRNFFHYYEREVFPQTMHETLAPFLAAGKLDLIEFGYRVTTNLTADFAGIDRPRRDVEETETLLRMVRKFSECATVAHSKRPHEEVNAETRTELAEFETRFFQPSKQRREALVARFKAGEIGEDALPRDVLTVLLRNEDRLDLPDDVLLREMAFYMQAGSHSTANSTTHAMHNILTWAKDHPEDAARLKTDKLFVQRCVHESLRLHPASPVAHRRATCPVHFKKVEAEMAEGDDVVVDLHAANRNPDIFGPDADRFNPHRTIAPGHDPFGLSFGHGIHACLGRDLDGGIIAKPTTDPEKHQYGIVALLCIHLLSKNARPDPDDAPVRDTKTIRTNWGRYPILLDA